MRERGVVFRKFKFFKKIKFKGKVKSYEDLKYICLELRLFILLMEFFFLLFFLMKYLIKLRIL